MARTNQTVRINETLHRFWRHAAAVWPYFLLVLGAAATVYGFARGEAGAVFVKAVHVCLECIGVG